VMIGLVSALGVLAKPSYVIALLPALGLIGVYWFLKKRRLDWVGLILGFFIPTVGLLAWQYLGAYSSERVIPDEAGIAFAPFIVYGRASGWLLPKFFLSFLFPLGVYSFYFSSARRDVGFNLAWLSFGVGALLTYFFAETGVRLQDANFAWSGQITLFVLYCVSTVFFIRQVVKREGCGKFYFAEWVCMGGFGLHLVSGLLWYVLHVVRPWDAWW